MSNAVDLLLQNAPHDVARARLLAVSAKESGAWLKALPVSSLGLRMDDSTIRVSIGLRLGSVLCRPHTCQHCEVEVDQLGTHGRSCKRSEGRHHRHSAVSDILHRALRSAQVPARLEPSGLTRSDGKRPDGVTLVPWRRGKPLVWDATCPDTLAFSYRANATDGAGEVAAMAEQKKLIKYDSLAPNYDIALVAIESLGAIGPLSRRTWDARRVLGRQGLMNTSCSVWQLQFSEEMLFPSWARWETLDKTTLYLDSILCLCL